jgi:signal transduction histidine kinase
MEHSRIPLARALALLEEARQQLQDELLAHYEAYIRALEQLAKDVDIDSAIIWSEEQRQVVEKRLEDMHGLAQIGITVEIIGHELNELDAEVERHLGRLPEDVRKTRAYRGALTAHRALMERLNFLAPMRMAGVTLKERIHGEQIASYLHDFFHRTLQQRRIELHATDAFRAMSFIDYPHRIYPVFVNLVNNAAYWVTMVERREIVLDRRDDAVIVADSGPGIEPDDQSRIFELFFTRRTNGRGVGLYLCKANLEVGDHSIEYISNPDERLLPGANFAIRFKGME